MHNKWIITGDIIHSRQLTNRLDFQNNLERVLERINQDYSQYFDLPLMITLGDEFSGVLNQGMNLLKIIWEINLHLEEVDIRYGLGYGRVHLQNGKLAGGSGYNHARQALQKCKLQNYPVLINNWQDNLMLIVSNLYLVLFFSILSGLTVRQNYILFQLGSGSRQKEVAEHLGISPAAVSQSLKNVNWRLLNRVYHQYRNLPVSRLVEFNKRSAITSAEKYTALTCSWKVTEQGLEIVEEFLLRCNDKYADLLEADFKITVPSDTMANYTELQGLIGRGRDFLPLLVDIISFFPDVYIGIGSGTISTDIFNDVNRMDGPVFHHARKALNIAVEQKSSIVFYSADKYVDLILTDLLNLLSEYILDWTDKQLNVVRGMEEGLTQQELAERLELSRVAVTNRLTRAGWRTYQLVVDNLQQLTDHFQG